MKPFPAPQWFVDGFGSAVADIRGKLVEEGWFGRAVTPSPASQQDSLAKELDQALTPSEIASETDDKTRSREVER